MKKLTGFKSLIADDFLVSGAEVDTADSGASALEMVKKNKYDFIISDMRMPNGDGRFLATAILNLIGEKPMLFLYSGYNEITVQESAALGIAQIFNKPFKSSEMIDSIIVHLTKLTRSA
jgi:CheY-like chemotaxis protein